MKKQNTYFIRLKSNPKMYLHWESPYALFSKKYYEKGKYLFKAWIEGASLFDRETAEKLISVQDDLEMIDTRQKLGY